MHRKLKDQGNLVVLYLWYPQGERYNKDRPLHELRRIIGKFECKKTIIYINNSATVDFSKQIAENEYEINGDNKYREFSGWQKGVEFARRLSFSTDAYLFANDMFLHDSLFYRNAFNYSAFDRALKYDAIVGKLKKLPVKGRIMGMDIDEYIRTHIFLVSSRVIDKIGSLVAIGQQEVHDFVISHYDNSVSLFQKQAPISEEIRDFIFHNITAVWHNKKPYINENFGHLKDKAVAILNSLMFSAKAKNMGYALMDIRRNKHPLKLKKCMLSNVREYDKVWPLADTSEEAFIHM